LKFKCGAKRLKDRQDAQCRGYTCTDFLVRGIVRRGFRGLKNIVRGNQTEYACSFFQTRFFACQPKDAHQNFGRGNRCV